MPAETRTGLVSLAKTEDWQHETLVSFDISDTVLVQVCPGPKAGVEIPFPLPFPFLSHDRITDKTVLFQLPR